MLACMETRFCEGQSSKGNYSKNINARVTFLHSAHRLMLIDTCMKFREDSLKGFQVTEWTRFVTDRQTDGCPGKNNMSPTPKGGRHNFRKQCITSPTFLMKCQNLDTPLYFVNQGAV